MPGSPSLIGRQLGVYEVDSLLGAGGMGEVYRARDTKLGRDVAIKILPQDVAGDPERLARFEREARVLASLNHPLIGAIYGFENWPAGDGGQVHGLILELVGGETLAERLTRGAIPVADATALARQIADALDAAHERSIIHRDFKPANVKITPSGQVKVLDFGIAKTAPEHQEQVAAQTTIAATREGVVLGTAPYMSPEQARGQLVDKRTDIWAFGCVLYEMLSGRRAFAGATTSDTIAAILQGEPDWTALPVQTPPGVVRLAKRCLEKNPQRRLRDLGDADLALELPAASAAGHGYPGWMLWTAATTAAIAVAGMAVVGLGPLRSNPPSTTPIQFQIPAPVRLTEAGTFSVSPDGRHLIFAGAGADGVFRLWIRSLDTLETRPVPGTESEELNFSPPMTWSPDSRSIAFYTLGKIKRIDRMGGLPRVVCEVPGVSVGGAWNTADVILVGNTEGGLVRCPAEGGAASAVTVLSASGKDATHMFPSFLPDNRHFVYLRVSRTDPSETGLYLGDLETPPERQSTNRLVATLFGGAYVPGVAGAGYLFFVRGNALMMLPLDAEQRLAAAEPTTIASDVGAFRDGAFFSATSSALVYRGNTSAFQLTWLDRHGVAKGLVGEPAGLGGAALSPDETQVIMWRDGRLTRSSRELWLVDVRRNTSAPFATGLEADFPGWSADGRDVFFMKGSPLPSLNRKRADGSGASDILLQSDQDSTPRYVGAGSGVTPTPDGRFVIFGAEGKGTSVDLWLLPLAAGGKPVPIVQQDFDQTDGRVSPNGQWLAYVSNESGVNEVFVRPVTWSAATGLPVVGSNRLVSNGGGFSPRWRRDGKELFYQTRAGAVMVVPFESAAIGTPAELFRAPGIQPEWNVSADGQRFLVAAPTQQIAPTFTVIANWQSGIKH